MLRKAEQCPFSFVIICLQILCVAVVGATSWNHHDEGVPSVGSLVRKDERELLVTTEYGEISAVEISDGSTRGRYHLQFMTLEPNALFLPVLLHADMVFYVHTGSGRLSWVDEDETRRVNLVRGDVYRLRTGTAFFVHSNLEQQRQKLRIYALFTNSIQDLDERSTVAYSSIRDLVLGFNKKVLQEAFNVPEEVIEEIASGTTPQAIVHAPPTKESTVWQFEAQFLQAFLGRKGNSIFDINNKKTKTFNILKADPDFQNRNGWSLVVTKKKLPALRGSNIGLLMVNLSQGSMMGPHWNPMASEISIVTHGRGIVRVVCSSSMSESECKDMSFRVEEGDVFVVPRFHPMAQMAFNDDSLVFMGFSTTTKKSHPQFLVGKASVLQTLDKEVLAASFNVTNTTISQLLAAQRESVILECTSCAEEEERKIEEEIEKEKEEARRREEEEAKKREEEEAQRREEERRKEEEEARRRKEEEAQRREEEERRKEEEERRKEEEEARRREEEEAQRREEEERRKEEEEEEARRREEEEQEEEEEAAARKREEEQAKREEEERRREEEEAKREKEEERRREEEEAKRMEEEEEEEQEEATRREEKRRREEEEAKRRREEEEEARREEEEAKRREEEKQRREEEEVKREEAEERRREEETKRREEEERKREEEEAKREEEEERRREEEETKRREEVEQKKEEEEEEKREEEEEQRREEEEAKREEEEERRREEETKRREEEERRRDEEEAKREKEKERRREEEEGKRRKEEREKGTRREERRREEEEEATILQQKREPAENKRRQEAAEREEEEARRQEQGRRDGAARRKR